MLPNKVKQLWHSSLGTSREQGTILKAKTKWNGPTKNANAQGTFYSNKDLECFYQQDYKTKDHCPIYVKMCTDNIQTPH